MSEQEDKIIKIYNSKQYDMTIGSFFNFINERIDVDSFAIDLIRQKIQDFGVQQTFTLQTFRLLIRLIAAVQSSGNKVKNLSMQQIMKVQHSVAFKFCKKSKNNQKSNQKMTQYAQNQKQTPIYISQKDSSAKTCQKKEFIQNNTQMTKVNSIKLQQIVQQPEQKPYINKKPQKMVPTSKQIQKKQQPQNNREIKAQRNESKPSHETSKPYEKEYNKLNTIEQVQNSSQINLTQNDRTAPMFLDMGESRQDVGKAKITQYQKFSIDYVNSVIKYTIQYKKHKVLRRFSEFQKLINILRQKYEGFILPELPPKQGIKAGMTYFWGIDEAFLEERKKKLQQFINRLLQTKFINEEQTLQWFLTDQAFEIQFLQQSYGAYLKTFTDIVFNAKQLKDYGVAYCNYLREKGNVKLNLQIQKKYEEIQKIIEIFMSINQYRKRINSNFDKRREIMYDLKIKSKTPENSNFDKMMDLVEEQIKNLTSEIEKYKKVKSQQSWIHELIRQKQADGAKTMHDLTQQQYKLQSRIKKMEQNLLMSLRDFKESKTKKLDEINKKILDWRENVHP